MSKKQLGAAPEAEAEAESLPGERLGWFARLRAQPGFRTAAVAFVLTVALGVGGPAAYAYWSQQASGKITGTVGSAGVKAARVAPAPDPAPSSSASAIPAPASAPSTSASAVPAKSAPATAAAPSISAPAVPATSAPATAAPATPAPAAAVPTPAVAPSTSASAVPAPARPALPALIGKVECGLDSTGSVAISRPTPASALPASAAIIMTIADPQGTTVYAVNQTVPVVLKSVPGLETRLKAGAKISISITTGYLAAPMPAAPIELIDPARVLEWSKSPAVSTGAAYDALLAKFSC